MKTFIAIVLTIVGLFVLAQFLGSSAGLGISLLVLGSSIWVLIDANRLGVKAARDNGLKGMGPVGWLLSCLLLWVIAFPYYLTVRGELGKVRKQCPACFGIVPEGARKCMHCGEALVQSNIAPPPPSPPQAPVASVASAVPAAETHIPCPLCSQQLRVSALKQGENWCAFCFQKFVVD